MSKPVPTSNYLINRLYDTDPSGVVNFSGFRSRPDIVGYAIGVEGVLNLAGTAMELLAKDFISPFDFTVIKDRRAYNVLRSVLLRAP